ncbi:hypothetical protein MD484_g6557, partial [Candolleomyces efflorescens]
MMLCEVASSWRQAALSEHRLWDTVIFPSPQGRSPSIKYDQAARFIRAGGVERWFNRTGTKPILSFGEEVHPDHHSSHISLFLPLITKYARRLRHISLSMVKIKHFEFLRRGFPYDLFENLETVSICCTVQMSKEYLHAFETLNTPFQNKCPKLTHASFTLMQAHPLKFAMPWPQLTSIRIDSPSHVLSAAEWAELFSQCRNLRHATIVKPIDNEQWMGPLLNADSAHEALTSLCLPVHTYVARHEYFPWDILRQPVQFPNLRQLHLNLYLRHDKALGLLRLLTADFKSNLPKLEAIQISTPHDGPFEIPNDVREFVEQLAPLIVVSGTP